MQEQLIISILACDLLLISLDLITRIFALLDLRSINVLGSNSGHPFNFQI